MTSRVASTAPPPDKANEWQSPSAHVPIEKLIGAACTGAANSNAIRQIGVSLAAMKPPTYCRRKMHSRMKFELFRMNPDVPAEEGLTGGDLCLARLRSEDESGAFHVLL